MIPRLKDEQDGKGLQDGIGEEVGVAEMEKEERTVLDEREEQEGME